MEDALRQMDCFESLIIKILKIPPNNALHLDKVRSEVGVDVFEKVCATIIATVGRGNRPVDYFAVDTSLTEDDAIALCVNISSNAHLKVIHLVGTTWFGTVEGSSLLGEALASNSTIEWLYLDSIVVNTEAGRGLIDGLVSKTTIYELDFGSPYFSHQRVSPEPLSVAGIRCVAELVTNGSTLGRLILRIVLDYECAEILSSVLLRNTNFEELDFWITHADKDGAEKLLQVFSGPAADDTESSPRKNSTINALFLSFEETGGNCLESVGKMIRTNNSLLKLELHNMILRPEDWKKEIFLALKENETLKELTFVDCEGLGGEEVRESVIDVLQDSDSKTRLEEISFGSRLFMESSMQSTQTQVDEELRINTEYRYALRG